MNTVERDVLFVRMRIALANMLKVHEMLMPGVKHIAVPDYQLLNEAPIEARKLLTQGDVLDEHDDSEIDESSGRVVELAGHGPRQPDQSDQGKDRLRTGTGVRSAGQACTSTGARRRSPDNKE